MLLKHFELLRKVTLYEILTSYFFRGLAANFEFLGWNIELFEKSIVKKWMEIFAQVYIGIIRNSLKARNFLPIEQRISSIQPTAWSFKRIPFHQ